MNPIRLVLMALAIACFVLAAFGAAAPRGGNLVAAGLALWAISVLLT